MQSGRTNTASENIANAGNKMASKTIQQHELKIMDVEGAVTVCEEPAVTIEVEEDSGEDVDNNNVSLMLAELESSLNGKSNDRSIDPLMEETMSAKIEPSGDEGDPYHDPMGLLSRLDSNPEIDSQDDDDDVSADDGSSGISSKSRKLHKHSVWMNWMKRWPWLLHEETDGTYAYCLYCHTTLNVNKQTKIIKQHNICMYHQEREKNYLAFKEREAKKNDDTEDNEVKHEFGTNEFVVAMKKKRLNEVDAFNDFNWERWLQEHPWLKRHEPQGTIGFCKSCNICMNVEFIYLRKRHEASKAHQQGLKQQGQKQQGQEKSSRKRKRSASTSADELSQPSQESSFDTNEPLVSIANGKIGSRNDPSAWCEFIPGTKYQQCRCTLCNIRMSITSFLRHCKTKNHCSNLDAHSQMDESVTDKYGIWAVYKIEHPWMVADPEDSTFAYCSICCKRFMYGHSEIKRKAHENSEKHLAAMATDANEGATPEESGQKLPQSDPDGTESGDSDKDDHDDDNDEEDEDEVTSEANKNRTGRRGHGKTKQTVRHYSWLGLSKDRKVQICKFCRVRFRNESDKARHEHSERHKGLVKQFHKRKYARQLELRQLRKEQQAQKILPGEDQENNTEQAATVDQKPVTPSQTVKPLPLTIRGKVMVWKDRYPWLSYKRNEVRPNYGWCKLCEVSVFLPSYKFASKHQRSTRHIRLRIERKRLALQGGKAEESTAPTLSAGEAKHKAAMQELQDKYDWLEPDDTEENYCHCRICETRLPIKVFYLRQHDASRKHSENRERLKSNDVSNTAVPDQDAETQHQQPNEEATTNPERNQDSEDDMSQKSDSSTAEPPQKRSKRSNEMRRIIRALRDSVGKRQDDRKQIELAKDMICSSFDIVARLRNLERTQMLPPLEVTAVTPPPKNTEHSNNESRHVMDLFLDSISATMKDLPSDLAAKGKAKIMQIVCDLEVEAMQRKTPIAQPPQTSSPTEPIPPLETSANNIPGSPDTISCSETLEDEELSDEPVIINNDHHNDSYNPDPFVVTARDLPGITQMTQHRRENVTKTNKTISTSPTSQSQTHVNKGTKEVQAATFRALPNTMQVTQVRANGSLQDAVRCVPLDKLTMSNRSNGSSSTATKQQFNNELNNSANSSFLRNFRVTNGNVPKVTPCSKPSPIMARLSGGAATNGGAQGSPQQQQQQAQYQRAQNSIQQRTHPTSGR